MKKLILYISSFLILIGLMFFIFKKDDLVSEIITVDKAYSLTDDQNLYINLYFTKNNHILTEEKAINNFSIANDNLKLSLDLKNITKAGEEIYLNKTYFIYQYEFKLPSVDQKLIIEPAILNILLENDEKYQFKIGKLSLEPLINNDNYTWTKLEGRRLEHNLYPRVGFVNVLFLNLDPNEINYIADSFNNRLVHYPNEENENELLIYLKDEAYILDGFPLMIYFTNDEVLQLPFFNYMILANVLNEAGPLINTYND